MSQSDLLAAREAAAIIGQSVATIKRLAKSGALPHAMKIGGQTGAYVFHRSDVDAYADARRERLLSDADKIGRAS